jgi:ankyrin repeat protein
MHIASANGFNTIIEFILNDCQEASENGAPFIPAVLSVKDKDGWTPLHVATFWGHQRAIEILLEHGGDVNARTNNDETVLELCDDQDVREFIIQKSKEIEIEMQHKQAAAAAKAALQMKLQMVNNTSNNNNINTNYNYNNNSLNTKSNVINNSTISNNGSIKSNNVNINSTNNQNTNNTTNNNNNNNNPNNSTRSLKRTSTGVSRR